MIDIPGRLTIKTMKGSRGNFCVGELVTDLAIFKVKDAVLDQYEEGSYNGTFRISKIELVSYMYYGRFQIEMRAKIADITLDSPTATEAKPLATPSLPATLEQDPIDEKGTAVGSVDSHADLHEENHGSAGSVVLPNAESDDLALFGAELANAIKAVEDIKLDPTVHRSVFRAQRDRLKALGYKFEPSLQSWVFPL
jgi:hypothetical protein